MKVLGYGEDALTLWAIQNKLGQILEASEDPSGPADCKIFFRPSFGRRGGAESSQFGEFDFIILSRKSIYPGESKWDRSPELSNLGSLGLRDEQVLRHRIFAFYIREWVYGHYISWDSFVEEGSKKLAAVGIDKPIAPTGSLLASNLRNVLGIIKEHFSAMPQVIDLLLYLYDGSKTPRPTMTAGGFHLVPLDYSGFAEGNFIPIEL